MDLKRRLVTQAAPILFPAAITALVVILAIGDAGSAFVHQRIAIAFTAGLGAAAWLLAVRYYPAPCLRGAATRVALGLEVTVLGVLLFWLIPMLPAWAAIPLSVALLFAGNLGISRLVWANPVAQSPRQLIKLAIAPWRQLRNVRPKPER